MEKVTNISALAESLGRNLNAKTIVSHDAYHVPGHVQSIDGLYLQESPEQPASFTPTRVTPMQPQELQHLQELQQLQQQQQHEQQHQMAMMLRSQHEQFQHQQQIAHEYQQVQACY
jgi:hypothetical protein